MKTKRLFKLLIFMTLISIVSLQSCNNSMMRLEMKKLQEAKVFSLSEDKSSIVLFGVINNSAYDDFKAIYDQNKHIKTIDIIMCEGSINDHVNLKLSKYIHQLQLNTHLVDSGFVASGGTDLFLAGKKRTCGIETNFGVHSWATESLRGKLITATDFPRDHKNHKMYIKYYQDIGFTEQEASDFYFFTINAAPADDIHWMTKEEIMKYKIITE